MSLRNAARTRYFATGQTVIKTTTKSEATAKARTIVSLTAVAAALGACSATGLEREAQIARFKSLELTAAHRLLARQNQHKPKSGEPVKLAHRSIVNVKSERNSRQHVHGESLYRLNPDGTFTEYQSNVSQSLNHVRTRSDQRSLCGLVNLVQYSDRTGLGLLAPHQRRTITRLKASSGSLCQPAPGKKLVFSEDVKLVDGKWGMTFPGSDEDRTQIQSFVHSCSVKQANANVTELVRGYTGNAFIVDCEIQNRRHDPKSFARFVFLTDHNIYLPVNHRSKVIDLDTRYEICSVGQTVSDGRCTGGSATSDS